MAVVIAIIAALLHGTVLGAMIWLMDEYIVSLWTPKDERMGWRMSLFSGWATALAIQVWNHLF